MIQSGTTLQQRYKIDKQIGQGGMGAVYVATDERFGSVVAIKETLCMDDNFRKAIEREARLLNSLKHSALPRVSDHFEEDNGLFLVMEYIPGDDVASILERDQKAFPIEKVISWADDLLEALDYLHNQNIPVIHRDIKPQNLKITPRGQIILLDFGLAKGNPTDASHHTAAKSIFGYSRNYASLEQIQGTGTDPRSDLYSLAATLYHLVTNVEPEDALTRAMAVLSQKPDPLVPANMVNPAVPAGIAGVLQIALDLNANERPASAAEMRQMLLDSENFAYLANASMASAAANAPTQPQIYAQATKLMSDPTRAGGTSQNEVKTEVLPGGLSQMTELHSPNTSAPAPKSRGLAMAAGAFSVLLIGAVIAGGLYFVKPSVFGAVQENETPSGTALAPTANNADTNATASANAETEQIEADGKSAAIAPSTGEPVHQPESPVRPTETSKNTKTTASAKPLQTIDLGDGMSVEMDDLENPTNVTIKTRDRDGKIKTMVVTPEVDPELGLTRPKPGDQFPPNFDRGKLTPEQRRKFQNMIKREQMKRPPPPRPQPTSPE
ncbi:MAG: serine/threonine-protein kinase [Pyrinomonadaceae bacterium]